LVPEPIVVEIVKGEEGAWIEVADVVFLFAMLVNGA
jgi:hypothetical protein